MRRWIIKLVLLVGFVTSLYLWQGTNIVFPQDSPQNDAENENPLEKQIREIIDAKYKEVKKTGGFVTNVPLHLGLSDMKKIRLSYGLDIQRFHRDIVSVLSSDPKKEAFWQVMFMVSRLDIRNEAVMTKMCEIAQHEPYLSYQGYAIGYLFRLRNPQNIPIIVKMMRADDPYVRQTTYNCINDFGDDVPQKILDLLIEDVNWEYDHGPYVPNVAITVYSSNKTVYDILAKLGPVASPVLSVLERLLQKEDDHLSCAHAICRIDPNHQNAYDTLAKHLAESEYAQVRKECAKYLGNLAPSRFPIEQELMRSYRQDISKDVRLESLRSLIRYLVPQGKGQPLLQELLDLDAKNDGSLAKFVFEGCYEYQSEEEAENSDDPYYDTMYEYNGTKVVQEAFEEISFLERANSAVFFVEEIFFRVLNDPERYYDSYSLKADDIVEVLQEIASPNQLTKSFIKYRSRQK